MKTAAQHNAEQGVGFYSFKPKPAKIRFATPEKFKAAAHAVLFEYAPVFKRLADTKRTK